MRKVALTERPGGGISEGKKLIEDAHDSFCPLLMCLLVHLVFEYRLHDPMAGEHLRYCVSLDQREAQQFSKRFIDLYVLFGVFRQSWIEKRDAFGHEFFGNRVRRKKGTQSQEIGSQWARCSNLLERERPGGGNGFWVIG